MKTRLRILSIFLCISFLTACGARNEPEPMPIPALQTLTREDAAQAFAGDAMAAALRQIRSETGEGIDSARFTHPFTIPTVRGDGSVEERDTTWFTLAYDDRQLYAMFTVFYPETEEAPLVLGSTAGISTLNSLLEREARHTGERRITLVSLPELEGTTTGLCFVSADGLVFPLFRRDPAEREGVEVAYLPALTPQVVLPGDTRLT